MEIGWWTYVAIGFAAIAFASSRQLASRGPKGRPHREPRERPHAVRRTAPYRRAEAEGEGGGPYRRVSAGPTRRAICSPLAPTTGSMN